MVAATLTSKGQLTLPREVRDALGVGPGDRVDFIRMDDGTIVLRPANVSVKSLQGLIRAPKAPVSLTEMDDAIATRTQGE